MPIVDLFHDGIKETANTRSLGQLSLYYASCLFCSGELLLGKLLLSRRELLLLSWIKLLLLWRKLLLLLKGLLLKLLLLLLWLKLLLWGLEGLLLSRKVLEARLLLTKPLLLLLLLTKPLLLGAEDLRKRCRRLLLGSHL